MVLISKHLKFGIYVIVTSRADNTAKIVMDMFCRKFGSEPSVPWISMQTTENLTFVHN